MGVCGGGESVTARGQLVGASLSFHADSEDETQVVSLAASILTNYYTISRAQETTSSASYPKS